MSIEYIIGTMPEGITLAKDLAEVLNIPSPQEGLGGAVLHLLGGWTPKARSRAQWARKHFIPVMHTPLGMLSPWYKPTSADIKRSEQAERLIAMGDMEYELLDGDNHKNTVLILNSLLTSSISREEMISLFQSHYLQMLQEMDQRLLNKAADNVSLLKEDNPCIEEILRQLYYIKDLDTRGNIPDTTMKKLALTMTSSDYDEDHMAQILHLIHMDKFLQQIEKRLFDKGLLTEGFMPIPMKE